MRLSPPTRWKVCSCSTRTILPWVSIGMSATSSRNSVPPSAFSKVPTLPPPSPSTWPGSVPNSRSEEHTSELQSLMRISYAVFCLKNKKTGDPSNQKSTRTNPRNYNTSAETTSATHYHTTEERTLIPTK